MSKEVKHKIIKASKWSTLSEVVSKAITPATYLVLATFLTPQEFGIATIPVLIVSFCQILWEQGFCKAIIQKQENTVSLVNIAYWCNLGMSAILYLLVFLFAPDIASFFKNPAASMIIRVQGILIMITAITSVYTSVLLKQIDFRSLFFARVVPAIVIPVVSIPLAYFEFSYWSLVVGTIAGGIVQGCILIAKSNWKPVFEFDRAAFLDSFSFSLWSTGEGILSWFYLWVDSIIVGYFLGSTDLGLYRTGSLIINSLFAVTLSPIFPVLFATLAQYQYQPDMFAKIFRNATRIIVILVLLIGCLLFSTADLFTDFLLNEKWKGIENVLMILGLSQALSWLISSNTEAFRARGRVNVVVRIMLVGCLYYFPTYILTSQHGLQTFLWGRLTLVVVTIPIYVYLSVKLLKLQVLSIFLEMKYVFVGAVLMTVFIILFKRPQSVHFADLAYNAGVVSAGLGIYILSLAPYKTYLLDLTSQIFDKKV